MMRVVRGLGVAVFALLLSGGALVGSGSGSSAQTIAPTAPADGAAVLARVRNVGTHVYLLRGWLDVFSTGMDDLGEKLRRRGVRASVHGHAEYLSLVDSISSRWKSGTRERVVIIGHSLGANAAVQMAAELGQRGIPVPLIITYDPTTNVQVTRNVSRLVNYYSSTNGWGTTVGRAPGFRGTLNNVDLSRQGEMGHTDIDKSPRLHSQSISYIISLGGTGRAAPATAAAPKSKDAGEKKEEEKPAASSSKDEKSDATAASKGKEGDKESASAEKPETAKSETAKSETAKSEPAKSETAKSETAKSETAKSEAAKSEPAKSETAKSETAKSETAKSAASGDADKKAAASDDTTASIDAKKPDAAAKPAGKKSGEQAASAPASSANN